MQAIQLKPKLENLLKEASIFRLDKNINSNNNSPESLKNLEDRDNNKYENSNMSNGNKNESNNNGHVIGQNRIDITERTTVKVHSIGGRNSANANTYTNSSTNTNTDTSTNTPNSGSGNSSNSNSNLSKNEVLLTDAKNVKVLGVFIRRSELRGRPTSI